MKQVTKINGQRIIITTNAKGRVTTKPAPYLEEDLQAAQVKAMRAMPEYGRLFEFAGDMNSEKRGHKAKTKALKTGLQSGEADIRLYFSGGHLRMVENKVGNAPLTASQKARHPRLDKLGHHVTVLRADTPKDAARQMVALVRGWIEELNLKEKT